MKNSTLHELCILSFFCPFFHIRIFPLSQQLREFNLRLPLLRHFYSLKNQFKDAIQTTQSKSNFFLAKRSLPAVTRIFLLARRMQHASSGCTKL